MGTAQPSKSADMLILDTGLAQIFCQAVLVELWNVPRTGNRPHVDDLSDFVRLQELCELLD